jgi:hypothetical protein
MTVSKAFLTSNFSVECFMSVLFSGIRQYGNVESKGK